MNLPNAQFTPAQTPEDGSKGYVFLQDRIVLAVNVALATRRPLLVTGLPGSGKSSLARAVAEDLGWGYVSQVFTSRTRVEDLISDVDLVRRLNDAQIRDGIGEDADYLLPGVLWWAVSPDTAKATKHGSVSSPLRGPWDQGVVVLLDEIDKAEPDLPNDLLIPLDRLHLEIPGVGPVDPGERPVLVVITSNGEREMPPAFLRRCVVLEIQDQDEDFLVQVARSHLGPDHEDLYRAVARRLSTAQQDARRQNRRMPSVAEYLDTVRACLEFEQTPDSDFWEAIVQATLVKNG